MTRSPDCFRSQTPQLATVLLSVTASRGAVMRSRAQIQSHPIHPMLVVMPLGLLIGSWIFDLIGKMTNNDLLWAASYYCAIAGIIAGLCAAIPGLIDWFSVV